MMQFLRNFFLKPTDEQGAEENELAARIQEDPYLTLVVLNGGVLE